MRTALFVLVAALACQAASADDYKPFFGKGDYAPKFAYVHKADPAPVVKPYVVQKVDKCRPATIVLSDPAVPACSTGYNLVNGTCAATVCKKVLVEAKPKPVDPKPVYSHYKGAYAAAPAAGNKYGFFKKFANKVEDKIAAKVQYVPKYADPKPTYITQEVCTVVTAKPVLVCPKYATLSGTVCITGAKLADCPKDYQPEKDICVKVTTIVISGTPNVTNPKPSYAPKYYSSYSYSSSGKGKYGFLSGSYAPKGDSKYAPKATETIPACPAPVVVDPKPVVVDHKVDYYKPTYVKPSPKVDPKPVYVHKPTYTKPTYVKPLPKVDPKPIYIKPNYTKPAYKHEDKHAKVEAVVHGIVHKVEHKVHDIVEKVFHH